MQDIYVDMDNRGGCCSGPVFVPVVKLGKPVFNNEYDSFEVDGIIIYVPKKFVSDDAGNITIKLRSILGQKSLIVNGILAYKEHEYGKKKF